MDIHDHAPGSSYIDKDFGNGVSASLNTDTHVFAVFDNGYTAYKGTSIQDAAAAAERALRAALGNGAIELFAPGSRAEENFSSSFQSTFTVREPGVFETFTSMLFYHGPRLGDSRRQREVWTLWGALALLGAVLVLALAAEIFFNLP